jgi:hypothetical protein
LYRQKKPVSFYVFFLLFLIGVGLTVYSLLLLNQTQKVQTDGINKIEITKRGVYKLYHEYEFIEGGDTVKMPVFSALENVTIRSEDGKKADVSRSPVKGGHKDGTSRLREVGIVKFAKAGWYTVQVKGSKDPLRFYLRRSSDRPLAATGIVLIVIGAFMCAAIEKRLREM